MTSVGFFPCLINEENHAMPLKVDDSRAQEIVDYMSRIGGEVDFETCYSPILGRSGLAYSRATRGRRVG